MLIGTFVISLRVGLLLNFNLRSHDIFGLFLNAHGIIALQKCVIKNA